MLQAALDLLATGDGYWLSLCVLAMLLAVYLRLTWRLLRQLRAPQHSAMPTHDLDMPASSRQTRTLAGLLGALCLLPLADYWLQGYSGYHSIGGLLPYSDAGDWLHGALHLATEGELTDWSARRPLNAVFLRGLLYLSDNQLPLLLILRGLLLGAVVGCWYRELARQLQRLPALFITLLLLLLAYPFVPLLLSEGQGLLFGLLGFTLLLRGATTNRCWSYALGAGLLACALMLRMGAFGILLGLLLWPLLQTANAARLRWLGATALCIAAGIGLSLLWGSLVYAGDNTSGSNFSYTLYGLAHAGASWQLYFEHHPQMLLQPEAVQARMAYQAAWAQMQAEPWALLHGLWQFFANYWRYLFVWVPGSLGQFLLPLFILGLGQLIWGWRDDRNRLLLLSYAGVLLTAPWIFWSANASRAFIATTPLELMILGLGFQTLWLASQGLWRQAVEPPPTRRISPDGDYGIWLVTLLCLACLTLVPSLASLEDRPPQQPTSGPGCNPPSQPLLLDPAYATPIQLTTGQGPTLGWRPFVFSWDKLEQHQIHPNPLVTQAMQDQTSAQQLWWVYDPTSPKRYRYLLLSGISATGANGAQRVCATPVGRPASGKPILLWRATPTL